VKGSRLLKRSFSWALGVSVRVKIMGIALGLVLLLGFGAILQVRGTTRSILGLELEERGASIARDVAARAPASSRILPTPQTLVPIGMDNG